MIPSLCSWCFTYDNVITPLNGATLEDCEVAIIDGQQVSHGMCEAHDAKYRDRYGLTTKGVKDHGR